MSLIADMTIQEVRDDPMRAQSEATPDPLDAWTPIANEVYDGSNLLVSASRPLAFEDGEAERNLKLGMTKQWAIGFFELSGAGAFSELMDLEILSGADYDSFEDSTELPPEE